MGQDGRVKVQALVHDVLLTFKSTTRSSLQRSLSDFKAKAPEKTTSRDGDEQAYLGPYLITRVEVTIVQGLIQCPIKST